MRGDDVLSVLDALQAHGLRVWLDGRQADLHPVTFAEDGTGWQLGANPDGSDCPYPASGFADGRILDRVVPCLSVELQVEHHRSYEPRDRDRADLARLAERFGLPLDDPY